jgi:hypothetical protein
MVGQREKEVIVLSRILVSAGERRALIRAGYT